MKELDIIIPVYNEGANIRATIDSLKAEVKTPFRVLICYDHEEDNTLPVITAITDAGFEIIPVKNRGVGVHDAIMTGFDASEAPAVLVFPADDFYNAAIIDRMYENFRQGNELVAASRFMKGGCMKGCSWPKFFLVRAASWSLNRLAFIPVKDASNGFRLFSRKLIDSVLIESTEGFTYSIELLVKCHRLGWKIAEVPASWYERVGGTSRFRLAKWLPFYIRWFRYGFETTYFRRTPKTVKLKTKPRTHEVLQA